MPFPAKTNSEAILASASDIIRSTGMPGLSMRTLAGRLGVRASSLYRHFPDRAAIERALAARSGKQLLEKLQLTIQGVNREHAVFAVARAYLDYAASEPAFYGLIMQSPESAQPVWNFFLQLMREPSARGDDTGGAATLWSFLHGFILLDRSGQLEDNAVKPAFSRGVHAVLRGLSTPETEAAGSHT